MGEAPRGGYDVLAALAIFCGVILAATLAPFQFQWLAARAFPTWSVWPSDVAQNILLFVVPGALLTLAFRCRPLTVLLAGAVLSGAIEFAQLSLPGRTSNFVDILTNAGGAVAGWAYGQLLLRYAGASRRELAFLFVLLPLCWVIALRAASQPFMGWFALPALLVGLALHRRSGVAKLPLHMHAVLWLGMAAVPLIYISRDKTLIELARLPLTVGIAGVGLAVLAWLVLPLEKLSPLRMLLVLAVLFGCLAAVDLAWFLAQPSPLVWRAGAHLHWADMAICGIAAGFAAMNLRPFWPNPAYD